MKVTQLITTLLLAATVTFSFTNAFLTKRNTRNWPYGKLQIYVGQDNTLEFSLPHKFGISLVGIHYNLNVPLAGVTAGQVNVDINSKTGDHWIYKSQARLKPGDMIYYWYLVLYNGQGFQETDQVYVYQGGQVESTIAKSTTRKSTTTRKPTTRRTTTPCPPDKNCTKPTPPPSGGGGWGSGPQTKFHCDQYPCIVWQDEFDRFDFAKWQHELTMGGGGNWEFQVYVNNRTNSYVRDGKLFLKPTLTSDRHGEDFLTKGTLDMWGTMPSDQCTGNQFYGCLRTGNAQHIINPITSARLRTTNSFAIRYGKIEVSAKVPTGDWIWPAIWMMPLRAEYGGWPASGEIDIMESRGNTDLRDPKTGKQVGNKQVGSTLHWGPEWNINEWPRTHATKNDDSGSFAKDFHTYSVEWNQDWMKFFVDEDEILHVDPGDGGFWKFGEFEKNRPGMANPWATSKSKMAPFDRHFYIILNVAVGGTAYFNDNFVNGKGGKPWSNNSPNAARDFWNGRGNWLPTWNRDKNNGEDAAMQIDWVRVYKMEPEPDE